MKRLKASDMYDGQNAECARIILRDPGRHSRIQIAWAQLFMEGWRGRQKGQGSLFPQEEDAA